MEVARNLLRSPDYGLVKHGIYWVTIPFRQPPKPFPSDCTSPDPQLPQIQFEDTKTGLGCL